MNLVIDASVALAWIFQRTKTSEAKAASAVLDMVAKAESTVPWLWHTEIANALLTAERRKLINEAQAIDYLERLDHLPINTDDAPSASRRDRVMALGREYGLTAYDATYLDLALRRDAALATFDGKLASAVERAGGKLYPPIIGEAK